MNKFFIIGYDPGGRKANGIAVLDVRKTNSSWVPLLLQTQVANSVNEIVTYLDNTCHEGRIVAAGIDTLTEWNGSDSGWRFADLWLRKTYLDAKNSIVSPNSMYGAMAVNGAAFLAKMGPRFKSDNTMITEAHPKVCYYALTRVTSDWKNNQPAMTEWLSKEFLLVDISIADEHCFDAGLAVLAGLRGLNGDWKHDLHSHQHEENGENIRYFGPTHFWWPEFHYVKEEKS